MYGNRMSPEKVKTLIQAQKKKYFYVRVHQYFCYTSKYGFLEIQQIMQCRLISSFSW